MVRTNVNTANSKAAASEPQEERFTPIVKLKTDHFPDFAYTACPITNDKWKERWRSMCATSTDNILGEMDEGAEEQAARELEVEEKGERWRAAPTFLEDECNLTSSSESYFASSKHKSDVS